MTDDEAEQDDPAFAPTDFSIAVEALVDTGVATGSAIAALQGHPELSIPIALAGPLITEWITVRGQQMLQAAGFSVAYAAEVAGQTPAKLLEGIDGDDRRTRLASEVIDAAAATLYVQKLQALGRCLAAGLSDDAALDTEWIVARALADLEEPHVLALHALTGWRDEDGASVERVPVGNLGMALSTWVTTTTMPAILTTLHRQGLIDSVPSIIGVTSATVDGLWVVTPFGRDVLRRIEDASPEKS